MLHNLDLIEKYVREFLGKGLKEKKAPLLDSGNVTVQEATVKRYGRRADTRKVSVPRDEERAWISSSQMPVSPASLNVTQSWPQSILFGQEGS